MTVPSVSFEVPNELLDLGQLVEARSYNLRTKRLFFKRRFHKNRRVPTRRHATFKRIKGFFRGIVIN